MFIVVLFFTSDKPGILPVVCQLLGSTVGCEGLLVRCAFLLVGTCDGRAGGTDCIQVALL